MWHIFHAFSLLRADFMDNVTKMSRCLAIKSRLYGQCNKNVTVSRFLDSTLTTMWQICYVISLFKVDFRDNLTNFSRFLLLWADFMDNVTKMSRCLAIKSRIGRQCDKLDTLSCYLESTLTTMWQICNVVSLFRVDFDGNVTNLTRCFAIKSRLWRQCDKFFTLSRF